MSAGTSVAGSQYDHVCTLQEWSIAPGANLFSDKIA
jgi:hypothetical protein